MPADDQFGALRELRDAGKVTEVGPVSYTHLDVYKRQIPPLDVLFVTGQLRHFLLGV